MAEGAIGGYGFATEELKSTDDFTHWIWLSLPDLGAREKVRAALDAIPQAERDAAQQAFLAAIDPSASRSTVLKSEMFAAAPALGGRPVRPRRGRDAGGRPTFRHKERRQ